MCFTVRALSVKQGRKQLRWLVGNFTKVSIRSKLGATGRYKSTLIHRWEHHQSNDSKLEARLDVNVELHLLEDITSPPEGFADVLVNATNEGLVGAQQSYFCRGDYLDRRFQTKPPEPWMSSANWCGMSAGPDMLYRSQCVDGLVHMKSGSELQAYLLDSAKFPVLERTSFGDEKRCETGQVVWSPAFGELARKYREGILHAVAPYYSDEDKNWRDCLLQCYRRVVKHSASLLTQRMCNGGWAGAARAHVQAAGDVPLIRVALPFLGTGVRGVPFVEGAEAAASAMKLARQCTGRSGIDLHANSSALPTQHADHVQVEMRFVTRDTAQQTRDSIVRCFERTMGS